MRTGQLLASWAQRLTEDFMASQQIALGRAPILPGLLGRCSYHSDCTSRISARGCKRFLR
jgi:hypothetical protein